MEDNLKEYQEKISYFENRLENNRILNEYQEKVIAEKDAGRIFSRLLGLVEHFLKPVVVGIFEVNESFEFDLFKITDKSLTLADQIN